ncbi:MAG: acyltransferase family protein [Planctomycetota bacterium]
MGDRNAKPTRADTSPRYPLLDALRVVAMLDIVAVHVGHRYLLEGIGLPVFIITAVALATRRPRLPAWHTLGAAAGKRARRVLVPWLVWTAVFAVTRAWSGLRSDESTVAGSFYPWMVVSGTSIHLWFLPFIFVAEMAVLAALALAPGNGRKKSRVRGVIPAAAVAAVAAVWLTGRVYDHVGAVQGFAVDSPVYAERAARWAWLTQKSWLFGLASAALGVVVGRTLAASTTAGSARPRRILLVAAAAACGLYVYWAARDRGALPGWPDPIHGHAIWQWWRQSAALLAVALAVQLTGRTPAWLYRLALTTLGIYLVHGWVNVTLLPPLDRTVPYFAEATQTFHGRVAVVWTLSLVLVILLRRTLVRRVL